MRLKAIAFLSALGMACLSSAQFNGPAPLAWRWSQFQLSSQIQLTSLGNSIVLGSPAVEGDSIYVASGQRMYGLGRADGNQLWRFPLEEPLQKDAFKWQPIIAGNLVVARSVTNTIYAVEKNSGKAIWTHRATSKGITGELVVAGNLIVYADTANQIHALRLDNGSEAWSLPLKIENGITGAITAKDDNIFVFNQIGELKCFNVASQKLVWSKAFATIPSNARAVPFGGQLYAISSSYVVCLDAIDARLRWQRDVDAPLALYPSVSAEGVLVVDSLGKAFCLDPLNGKLQIKKPIDFGGQLQVTPAPVGKLFVGATGSGDLVLLNPHSGEMTWRFRMKPTRLNRQPQAGANGQATNASSLLAGVGPSGSPVGAGNSLLVMAQDASLFCFDSQNGVDVTPPHVRLAFPTPGESVNGQSPLALYFEIEDLSSGFDPDSVKFFIDGKELVPPKVASDVPIEGSIRGAAEVTREGFFVIRVSDTGALKPLTDGRHTFTVKSRDWLGNQGSEDFILNIDNQLPPLKFPGQGNPGQPGQPGFGNPGGGVGGGGGAGGGGGGRGRGG